MVTICRKENETLMQLFGDCISSQAFWKTLESWLYSHKILDRLKNVNKLRRVRSFFGGEVHFKLERTLFQQSLTYISMYNTEGASFSSEERKMFLCNFKIRIIILTITHW